MLNSHQQSPRLTSENRLDQTNQIVERTIRTAQGSDRSDGGERGNGYGKVIGDGIKNQAQKQAKFSD